MKILFENQRSYFIKKQAVARAEEWIAFPESHFENYIAISFVLHKRPVNFIFDTLYCSLAQIFQEKRVVEGRKIYCIHSRGGHVARIAHDPMETRETLEAFKIVINHAKWKSYFVQYRFCHPMYSTLFVTIVTRLFFFFFFERENANARADPNSKRYRCIQYSRAYLRATVSNELCAMRR